MLECLSSIAESVKDFFRRDWTMSEKVLVVLCCVMFGVIEGFLTAPVKKGISCWNRDSNNSSVYNQFEDESWTSDED